MKQSLALVTTASIALAASGALATTPDEAFRTLDADGDGVISRAEFMVVRENMFGTMDTDADGLLSAAEIEAARASMPQGNRGRGNRMQDMDANGDGQLSLEEFNAQTPGFDPADRNGDGAISQQEFTRVARILARYAR
jgi:Ca2+-binding EF-hand superfamily protein